MFVQIILFSYNLCNQCQCTNSAVENTEERMIKGKKVQGVGLGNIFNDGPIKLRKTGNSQEQQPPPKVT